ncbi:Interleukin-17A [Fukomys damarensis]|uniref:Interleukin-17A n=1 Tax=Fukomys damarensis TaxID=885580 RepID=A0A091DIQ5_FUKDA|nr:Interleukin-17A [Fukomys damarensis]
MLSPAFQQTLAFGKDPSAFGPDSSAFHHSPISLLTLTPTVGTLHRNEDPERYPSVIWEAECRFSGCVNTEGEEVYHVSSVPIQQEILVLRREPQNCPLSFRLEKMKVTVGCTCVTPVVRHMG